MSRAGAEWPRRTVASRPVATAATDTPRLRLREAHPADADFVLRLLNDPGWIEHIGDRGVRSVGDALGYIDNALRASYARHGFGLYVVEIRDGGERAGLCGLIRRAELDDVDLGYAFLPEHRGRGLALEAARAIVARARDVHGLARIVAITLPRNAASAALLTRLGFRRERSMVSGDDRETLDVYALAP